MRKAALSGVVFFIDNYLPFQIKRGIFAANLKT